MNEIEYQKLRLKRKHQLYTTYHKKKNTKTPSKELQNMISRVLMAVIFVLISTIYINWSTWNKENYKKSVFETSLSFTAINSWYENKFGNVLPLNMQENTTTVNKSQNTFTDITKYYDGVMVQTEKESVIETLNSGIVVFIGEKEHYGKVVIIQGIDGVDIWYGNIDNINVSLYDYVEKENILGSAKDSQIYFVIQKDGQYLDYEEYKSQI